MADQAPPVTAVVATKDRLELLERAVGAIVAQRYGGVIETIVVIDGGEHPTDLAQASASRPVRIIDNARAPGLAGARNTGIVAATGEYVAFCDDDDVWHPDKMAEQIAVLERHPEALLAVTGMTVVRAGRRIDRVLPTTTIGLRPFLERRVQEVHPSSFVWRKTAFERIGLVDEDLAMSYGEDWDMLLRVARIGDVLNVPRSLLDVHWHDASFFANRWAVIATALEQMTERHPELTAYPRGHARLLGRQAFALAASGERRDAVATAGRALRRWGAEPRAWIALAVAGGLVSASRVQRMANAVGRGP